MTRAEVVQCMFRRWGADKDAVEHNYVDVYAEIPEDIKSILEIGVSIGSSMLAWYDLFPLAEIYGVDIDLSKITQERKQVRNLPRIHLIQNDATSHTILAQVPTHLDLIVDDGSHKTQDMLQTWRLLGSRASTYIIEDVENFQIPLLAEIGGEIIQCDGHDKYKGRNGILKVSRSV
jgi:precorrin-6B methylase 2